MLNNSQRFSGEGDNTLTFLFDFTFSITSIHSSIHFSSSLFTSFIPAVGHRTPSSRHDTAVGTTPAHSPAGGFQG